MNWLTSRIAPAALLATLALAACDKGTDLNVDLPDTTAISTSYMAVQLGTGAGTVQLKPVETLKTDRYLIGRLTENVSGTTTAATYFNPQLTMRADSLPSKFDRPVLDSVVLIMDYERVYGSATTPARFDIYNLTAKLDEREVYNSESVVGVNAAPLAQNLVGRLDRTRQVASNGSDTNPSVMVTVPDQTFRLLLQRSASPMVTSMFFNNLFNAMNGSAVFNQAALEQQLKGLAIMPNPTYSSGILSFSRGSVPRIEVYFHETDKPRKWRAYPIAFGPVYSAQGGSVARDPRYFTRITSTLTDGTELRALTSVAPPAPATVVPAGATSGKTYLQEGVGLGTIINLNRPELRTLRNLKGLAINRAELRVPLKPYTNALFSLPGGIYALEADANNRVMQRVVNFEEIDRAVQVDGANPRGVNSEAYSGPAINSGTATPYYSLVVTNYLQAYLNNNLDGELPNSLILVPNIRRSFVREPTLGLNRAVVDAENITLYIYYSQQ
ncbi:hypothetical protein GCM10023185_10800 [Hymenobacter saemangeumensis]|uniref:DUF4270 family protein n=1 Tax=Hymenobacter saemangeumensis TaxID=1084522 RepID=A0ABP8I5J2_9BACT